MSCQIVYGIDVDEYLESPDAPGHSEFDRHVRECRECRERVYLWANLSEAADRDDEAAEHPDPAQLVGHVDGTLDAAQRAALEAHLATCGYCRDELAVLQAPARPVVLPPSSSPGSVRRRTLPPARSRLRTFAVSTAAAAAVGGLALLSLREPALDGIAVGRYDLEVVAGSTYRGSGQSYELQSGDLTRVPSEEDAEITVLIPEGVPAGSPLEIRFYRKAGEREIETATRTAVPESHVVRHPAPREPGEYRIELIR